MKKGWVIYSRDTLSSKFGDNAFDWMRDSALKYGLEVEILFEEDFTLMTDADSLQFYMNGQAVQLPDFVMMRSYGIDLAKHLELSGVRVFNTPASMLCAQDKWATHQCLAKHDIASPKSIIASGKLAFDTIAKHLGAPFVIKGLYGSKGEEVFLADSSVQLEQAHEQLPSHRVMYQKFVAESAGTDIRVHVIGGEVVAAVRRKSEGDFKSNYHQGGSAEYVALTTEMAHVAIRSAKALNLDFAGVDLLETHEGVTVCEVNAIPGFRTVCITSDTDIPSLLFKYINEKMK